MELNLTKPIVFFDLETTGVTVGHDHIVEICLHKVMPGGATDTRVERVNASVPSMLTARPSISRK